MAICPRCQQEDGLALITITRVVDTGPLELRTSELWSVAVCLKCEQEIVAEAESIFNRAEE